MRNARDRQCQIDEFYQPHQMWEFKRYYPLRLKRNAKSQSEIIYIRYMCINIVANYKVRCAPLARQPVSQCLAKNFRITGMLASPVARLTAVGSTPRQGTPAAKKFFNKYPSLEATSMTWLSEQTKTLDHLLRVTRCMFKPAFRGR